MTNKELIARAERAGWIWHAKKDYNGYSSTGWQDGNTFHGCTPIEKATRLRGNRLLPHDELGFDHEYDCHECGKPIWLAWSHECNQELRRLQECFNCNYWLGISRKRALGMSKVLVMDMERTNGTGETRTARGAYEIGSQKEPNGSCGYGGAWWNIRVLHTGIMLRTCDLWHRGEIPERFLGIFPVDAEVYVDAVELMKNAAIEQEYRENLRKRVYSKADDLKKILKKKRR